jgi:uncharacterized protein YndB with AHSA1/START domain
MPDILHAVGIKAQPSEVYEALTTLKGLSGWWTSNTRGDPSANGTIQFHFGEKARVDAKVIDLKRNELVLWEILDAHADWIGTNVRFELRQNGPITQVMFKHEGWKQPTDFMHHCSTKWATFLVSLKALLEDGAGAPYPNDVQIASQAA